MSRGSRVARPPAQAPAQPPAHAHHIHLDKRKLPVYPPDLVHTPKVKLQYRESKLADIYSILKSIHNNYKLKEYKPSSGGDEGTQEFVDFVCSFNATAVALYDDFKAFLVLAEKEKNCPRAGPTISRKLIV